MKWISLKSELPPYNKYVVLLSSTGLLKVTSRKDRAYIDNLISRIRRVTKREPTPLYDSNGISAPNKNEKEWTHWVLLPDINDK